MLKLGSFLIHKKFKSHPWLEKIASFFYLEERTILLLIAILIGIAAGFASVAFRYLLISMHHFFFVTVYGYLSSIHYLTLPLIPVIGAVLLIP